MSKITPFFLFLAVALIIWSAAAGLSSYLSYDLSKAHSNSGGMRGGGESNASSPPSPNVAALRKEIEAGTKEPEPYLNLAYLLLQEAHSSNNSSLIMESVKVLHDMMKIHPEHPDALLALATICLQTGIIDKALEYYPRYLKLRADDLRARSDYSLALVQAGKEQEALDEVATVLKQDQEFVPGLMAQAIAYRGMSNIDLAEKSATMAKEAAQDPELITRIEGFIAELRNPKKAVADDGNDHSHGTSPGSSSLDPEQAQSPARAVQEYFAKHAIIGPKLKGIQWPQSDIAEVSLENFPVEQMPEFARQKFVTGVEQNFSSLGQKITIRLVDSESKAELISLDVGVASGK